MKKYITKIKVILLTLLVGISITSCDDDGVEFGSVTSGDLNALIIEAQTILSDNTTSSKPGDYQASALEMIKTALDKAIEIQTYSYADDQLTYGYNKLNSAIERADKLRVALAMPWIQQEDGTNISISDNIKPLFSESFTIETQIYIVNLEALDYSSNVIATEQDGPDSGFVIRYFKDGIINLNVGTADGWKDVKTDAGVMKAGEWMQIAFVNEITSQKLYVNGVEVLSQTATYLPGADKSFIIGNGPTWTSRGVNALMKDVRVWKGARSATQIADNRTTSMDGTETGLECFLPLNANLGTEFNDLTGNYTATLNGKIEWVTEPPVIAVVELDFTSLKTAIAAAEELKSTVVEGSNDGDYPVGTIDFIQSMIDDANALITNAEKQNDIESRATSINGKLELVNAYLVASTMGVYIDHDDSDAVGFRITPNYTPQGDYTVEFDVNIKTFAGYSNGELFNNGNYGVWVYGYEELTEENLLKAGGLWNFTNAGNGWEGPKTDPLVMKPGEWQHVAIVHDNTARTTALYVDGVQKAISEDIGAPENSGWGETWLGNGWGKMNGSIKDFRRWDVVRATADLNADIDGTEPGLNAYFPLDKVGGVMFKDVTGNYDGEMRGIKWNIE